MKFINISNLLMREVEGKLWETQKYDGEVYGIKRSGDEVRLYYEPYVKDMDDVREQYAAYEEGEWMQ